jgi:hypothetical protein
MSSAVSHGPVPVAIALWSRRDTLAYFLLTILGFSFWFFMAVPFASHRETYWWLAKANSESFSYALSFIASTYRPLHQVTTWIAFQILDPSAFPTSVVRQTLLQLCVYVCFVVGWWFMFSTAPRRRIFALIACAVGGVFFSGYVHLFHIYGLSYVPVILTLGVLLHLWAAGTFSQHETKFAAIAVLLVLWHPFTTALFVGFFFGHYLETFHQRSPSQHARSITVLAVGTSAVGFCVIGLPYLVETSALLVETASRPVDTRLLGFLVSYQTNEVNWIASSVAYLLTIAVVVTVSRDWRLRLAAVAAATVLSVVCVRTGVPVILLWVLAALAKLITMRSWSLFFLGLTAALLPFGGGIGTPIHGLFALIVSAYVTALAWPQPDMALARVNTRYVAGLVAIPVAALLIIRAGIGVPGLTRVARPLLVERERTYQLESVLAWLHNSEYCGYTVGFAEVADNPIDSVESAITRQYRPPSSQSDVQLYWNTVLMCDRANRRGTSGTAIVTFGGPPLADARSVFEIEGQYGGPVTVWVKGLPR